MLPGDIKDRPCHRGLHPLLSGFYNISFQFSAGDKGDEANGLMSMPNDVII